MTPASNESAIDSKAPLPTFFAARDRQVEALWMVLLAITASGLYWWATTLLAPGVTPGPVEFWGTATSLASVLLVRSENQLAWPLGIVSVVLMGAFFFQIDLVGQGWLHFGFYFPVQWWGWWSWVRGGEGRSELPVTELSTAQRWILVGGLIALTGLFSLTLSALYDSAVFVVWDSSVVAASVAAQLLMSRKKLESWFLWLVPVNISAIGLYLASGAFMFAALYVVFLANAIAGLRFWNRSLRSDAARRRV